MPALPCAHNMLLSLLPAIPSKAPWQLLQEHQTPAWLLSRSRCALQLWTETETMPVLIHCYQRLDSACTMC